LFLYMMRDVHITPYKSKTVTNPYIKGAETTDYNTSTANPDIPIEDHPWNGSTDLSEWRNIRDDILMRDNYQCQDCATKQNIDAHHIKERWKGGQDIAENLVTLCKDCHVKRGGYGRPRRNK
jgi:RNA-directed DNA polymerase